MKPIRYLAALLMLITGVMHILPIFKMPDDPNSLPMLGFGIAFLIVCVLLILNKKAGPVLGIIFTAAGLGVGFFKLGVSNWNTMLTIMFIIDAVVLVCCVILLLNRKNAKAGG